MSEANGTITKEQLEKLSERIEGLSKQLKEKNKFKIIISILLLVLASSLVVLTYLLTLKKLPEHIGFEFIALVIILVATTLIIVMLILKTISDTNQDQIIAETNKLIDLYITEKNN